MQSGPLSAILPSVIHGEGLVRMARSPVTQADCSLGGVTIFADLPGKALERVQQCCSWRRYQPGESIVGYLDSSDDVFFVISGEVRVTCSANIVPSTGVPARRASRRGRAVSWPPCPAPLSGSS